VEDWVIKSGMNGKVTLMYDHATQHCGYYLPESGTVRFQISLSPRALRVQTIDEAVVTVYDIIPAR
jgi:hypothetical protein